MGIESLKSFLLQVQDTDNEEELDELLYSMKDVRTR